MALAIVSVRCRRRDAEIEIKLGTPDRPPSNFEPGYELWTVRRERWFAELVGVQQHSHDRGGGKSE
jgi:hypothetical protein